MIDRIEAIVRDASRLMTRPGHLEITSKGGYANIVTSADLAVQDRLQQQLSQLLPGSGFVCEERDIADTAGRELVWIIDPIDGTANYARGTDACAISVGLRERGRGMVAGVVYLPRTGELFRAERGRGATRNGEPIHVSGRPFADSVMCTALPVYHKEHARECGAVILDVFAQCNDIRRLGAAAPELCYLAMGRFDLYFEYLLSPWDYAAASLIIEEAGGCLCALDGAPLSTDAPSGVLAANCPDGLARLQAIVASHHLS